jgi:hypothetical protein
MAACDSEPVLGKPGGTNTHGRWPLDFAVVSARVVAAAAASSQIFRYGTREHAAVSSETGDFCEATLVPRDRDRSGNLNLSGDLVVLPI